MSAEEKTTPECETCGGTGIVAEGTCPDCMGSGDETDDWLAFEKFINSNIAKRLGEGEIEEHALAAMWNGKMDPWAKQLADDHGDDAETLEFEDSAFCESHECAGCAEGDAPCESYKLWFAGMQMARALRAEMRRPNREPRGNEGRAGPGAEDPLQPGPY